MAFEFKSLAMTYSHMGTPTLPSALRRFTSEFGMESGVSILLWSPGKLVETFSLIIWNQEHACQFFEFDRHPNNSGHIT